jgi:orotidine-5'-phosphate decarboxylase
VAAADLKAAGYCDEMVSDVSRLVLYKSAMAGAAGCAGIVCSGQEVACIKAQMGPTFLAITPGVRPNWGAQKQDDQRRVVTPAMAIKNGADYLVVGRPIRDADDPVEAAQRIAEEIENLL